MQHVSNLIKNFYCILMGDTHMTSTWSKGGEGRGLRQKWGGDEQMFWTFNIYFFTKENWICAMTRHKAEPNINILLTRNLPFDSFWRQTVKPSFNDISLHCLWYKSNNKTRGQFECEVTWLCFCFDFARSHAR